MELNYDHFLSTSSHFSMLVGEGAYSYAMEQGIDVCSADELITGKPELLVV